MSARSGGWAERGFGDVCGSGMFFRVTSEGQWLGDIELPLGMFDEADGLEITNGIDTDHKPDGWSLAGIDARRLPTRADCVGTFGGPEGGGPED